MRSGSTTITTFSSVFFTSSWLEALEQLLRRAGWKLASQQTGAEVFQQTKQLVPARGELSSLLTALPGTSFRCSVGSTPVVSEIRHTQPSRRVLSSPHCPAEQFSSFLVNKVLQN